MTEPALFYRTARPADAPAIVRLVNAAYRGPAGWTRETHILAGDRTDESAVLAMMQAPESLILLCLRGERPVGCVHLKRQTRDEAYLGMLAVDPGAQEGGLGKRLMNEAEAFAGKRWGATAVSITVIDRRPELVAYYLRRGYAPTGETQPFPSGDGPSVALVKDLELVVLRKPLQ
jgi:ribosomal protein S18 acetylase RimI-like enzyme